MVLETMPFGNREYNLASGFKLRMVVEDNVLDSAYPLVNEAV